MPCCRIRPPRSAGHSPCPRLARFAYQSAALESGLGVSRGHRLVWRTRSGAEQVVIDEPSDYGNVSVAPDGRRAVVSQVGDQAGNRNLWIVDLARSIRRRFTFGTADRGDAWLPDGLGVVFTAEKERRIDLYRKSTDGTGAESAVLSDDRPKMPLGDNSELGGSVGGGYVRWNFFTDLTVSVNGQVWVKDGRLVAPQ